MLQAAKHTQHASRKYVSRSQLQLLDKQAAQSELTRANKGSPNLTMIYTAVARVQHIIKWLVYQLPAYSNQCIHATHPIIHEGHVHHCSCYWSGQNKLKWIGSPPFSNLKILKGQGSTKMRSPNTPSLTFSEMCCCRMVSTNACQQSKQIRLRAT